MIDAKTKLAVEDVSKTFRVRGGRYTDDQDRKSTRLNSSHT